MKSSKKIISLFLTIFVLLAAISLAACKEESYTVSFDSVGGSAVESVSVLPGEKVTAPAAPTKDGYVFMGWYNGTTVWNFDTDTVDADLTLMAKWITSADADAVTVSFDSNGGSPVESVTVGRGVKIGAPTVPARPGYKFEGWYCDKEYYDFESTVVVSDMTLTAAWTIENYAIAYDVVGGQNAEGNPSDYTVESEDIAVLYPTKAGYNFVGWTYEGQTEPVKDLVIKKGTTGTFVLTASWQKITYPLVFDLAGGTAGAEYPASYDVETASFTIANPTRDYYEFIGWTYEGQTEPVLELSIAKGTTGAKTLVANWSAIEYKINYDLGGGENNPENPASYNVASGIVTIKAPSRAGYTFKGWLYEGLEEPTMELEIAAASTGERSYTATWEIITYNITYVAEGAQPSAGTELQATFTVEDLPLYPASVFNYTDLFLGWCTDEALTSPVKFIENCGDVTLYAKFTAPTEGIVYTDMGNYYAVSGYEGEETTLYIPEFYNGKPVLEIASRAFKASETLTEIYLPYGITYIREEAFYNCDALVAYNIRLDAVLDTIEKLAFADCDALASVEFGFNVDVIGERAFYDTNDLASIDFGSGVSSIGASAFENCDKITAVSIPASVTVIQDRAFYSASALASVSFADGSKLQRIGNEAFMSASAITELAIPASVTYIGERAFHSAVKLESISFSEDAALETIGAEAFRNCKLLASVSIPDSVISIGNYAFYSAASLASVSFGEDSKLESIGDFAFYNCDSITEITVPASVKTIGAEAFSDANAIAKVVFAEGSRLKSIGVSAFSDCSKLTEILIPDSAKVNTWAFYGCINLKTVQLPLADETNTFASYFGGEKYIPTGIKSLTVTGDYISSGSLEKLTSLESLTVFEIMGSLSEIFGEAGVPETLKHVEITGNRTLATNAFDNCGNIESIVISGATTLLEDSLFGATGLKSLTLYNIGESVTLGVLFNTAIPASLTKIELTNADMIPVNAFVGSSVESVILNGSVSFIDASAFRNCNKLKTIVFGEDVTLAEIRDSAFEGCSALSEFIAPATLSIIGDSAFGGCSALKSISFAEDSLLTIIGEGAFASCTSLESFVSPAYVSTILPCTFENCKKLASVTLSDETVLIGSYAFKDCVALAEVKINQESKLTTIGASAFENCAALAAIDITNGVKSIGSAAFKNCASLQALNFSEANALEDLGSEALFGCESLLTVAIPATIGRLQNYVFKNCSSLASVTFGEGSVLSAIDEGAFENCSALAAIIVPDGVITVSNNAFKSCESLKALSFGENSQLSSILAGAFNGCISLESIAIPAGVYTIDEYAFNNCQSLKSVSFAENSVVSFIGTYAFADCDAIASFTVPASVKVIGEYAFFSCSSLASISYAEGITISAINAYTFYDCTALKSITVPASVSVIAEYAFYNASALESVSFAEGTVIDTIGASAFRNTVKLASFTAPETLRAIGEYAFSGCTGLKFVKLSLNVRVIGAYAFRDCSMQIRFAEANDGSTPIGWDTYWNPEFCPIEWSYTEPLPQA